MIDRIKRALQKNEISLYRINEEANSSTQLFFIKKRLDMRRISEEIIYQVTVFREFNEGDKRFLGQAAANIHTGMSDEEIEMKVQDAYYAASFVKNPFYELPEKVVTDGIVTVAGNLSGAPEDIMQQTAKALYAEDTAEDVWINSAEIFVLRFRNRVVTSYGTDAAYEKTEINGEFVAQCKEPNDVETYESFRYDNFDENEIRRTVKRILQTTKDRAFAKEAPSTGTYRVIISGRNVSELLNYYAERAHSGYIYPGYSKFKIGDNMQGDNVTGDLVNLTLKATVPYSDEGVAMKDLTMVENGIMKLIQGGSRFAYYLGVKPTGEYSRMAMPAGTVSFEEMKQKPYLYVVNFSGMEMDSLSGNFGGEIRLAYLFDGKNVTPVTGGSISGSIFEAQKKFCFSKDMQNTREFDGPFALALEDVKVAGK